MPNAIQRLRKSGRTATQTGPLILIVSSILSFGCQGFFDSEAADTRWREDYARCRFGMTLEQLEAWNENSDAKTLRQNPSWEACLSESGWNTRAQSGFGPQWDD